MLTVSESEPVDGVLQYNCSIYSCRDSCVYSCTHYETAVCTHTMTAVTHSKLCWRHSSTKFSTHDILNLVRVRPCTQLQIQICTVDLYTRYRIYHFLAVVPVVPVSDSGVHTVYTVHTVVHTSRYTRNRYGRFLDFLDFLDFWIFGLCKPSFYYLKILLGNDL